jgi:molybdate transport system substrate-binding protein
MASRLAPVIAMLFVAGIGSCGGSAVDDAPGGRPEGTLLVSAAASLTDVFAAMAAAFEADHPEVDVVLNFAGSSALREQILEGAPVDVFASANRSNMDQVVSGGEVAGQPRVFAGNLLQIAVPAGNPAGIAGLAYFAAPDLLIGLCAPGVPCGDFAREALAKAGVVPSIDTNEPDVRALLTKIEAGELDAGITYVTDVVAAHGAATGIDVPAAVNVAAEYPIAVMTASPNPTAAGAFVDFVLSTAGASILREYGFTTP